MKCFTYCGDQHCCCEAKSIKGSILEGEYIPIKEDICPPEIPQSTDQIITDLRCVGLRQEAESTAVIAIERAVKLLKYFSTSDPLEKMRLSFELK